MTGLVTVLNPDVRAGIARDGSLDHVLRNFASPIRRAREGAREDDDHFIHNYVAHPLSWGLMGLYMKERGHSSLTALAFTQLHSIGWEYVIEGSFQKPSGTDLITNFTSAAVAIFALHDLSERAAGREEKDLRDRILAALNPLRPLRGILTRRPDGNLAIVPTEIEGTLGLALQIGF